MNPCFQPRQWMAAHGQSVELGPKSRIMGILNVTPDSFSDGGVAANADDAVERALQMHAEGADIIDVGGESTRPGAEAVSATEEQKRILPVIDALAAHKDIVISVDTYRAETAELAIEAGAHIINDVWGFQKDGDLAGIAAKHRAGVCTMHTGREREKAADVVEDQIVFLRKSLVVLGESEVAASQIVVDPGFGFAKDPDENMELLARLEELQSLGFPVMVGTSRKRFIGHFTGNDVQERDIGTAATSVVARMKGAAVFRVHDVAKNREALAIADAVINKSGEA